MYKEKNDSILTDFYNLLRSYLTADPLWSLQSPLLSQPDASFLQPHLHIRQQPLSILPLVLPDDESFLKPTHCIVCIPLCIGK